MANPDLARRLRDVFLDADYTVDAVVERIGDAGQRALGRNSTLAAQRHLGEASDPLSTIVRMFVLQQPVPRQAVEKALPGLVEALMGEGVLAPRLGRGRPRSESGDLGRPRSEGGDLGRPRSEGGDSGRPRSEEVGSQEVVAAVDIRPYASDDGASGWVVSDLTNGLDGLPEPPREDHVLGLSPASTSLAQLTIRRPVTSALDLGSGCGVQSLHLARHAERVVATDLNPRANELAAWTFALNDITVDQRLGSLYEPVADERFDLIVTNPPYVMSPPGEHRLTYREGSFTADGLMEEVVRQAGAHLNPGGTLQVLGNWAITDDERWMERLRDWVPAGCDALIMERERLDPYEYVEIWLADAGLQGRSEYADRYREWLDYFSALGITGVGMGWLAIHRTDSDLPDVRVESWPHAVEQPVGEAFALQRDGVAAARCSDDVLLATRWRLAEDVIQETIGAPGAEDPSHLVLRSQRGFRRAVEVDTALGGVLGACDGDLALGTIIDAVAGLLEVSAPHLRADVVPRVREMVSDGMLVR